MTEPARNPMTGTPGQINLFAVAPDNTVQSLGPLYLPAGFDPAALIQIISTLLQVSPQLIALIKQLIDAFKPKPSPPNPGPGPAPSPFGSQP